MLKLELDNKETGENVPHLLKYMTFPIFKTKFMENCTIIMSFKLVDQFCSICFCAALENYTVSCKSNVMNKIYVIPAGF